MALGSVSIPSKASFEETAKILNGLLKNMPEVTKNIKQVKPLIDGMTDVRKRVKEVKDTATVAEKLAKEARNRLKELTNLSKEFNKLKGRIPRLEGVADNLKAGNFNKVMPKKSASGLVLIAGIAAAALGVALISKQNEIWEYDAKTQTVREASINADFQFSLRTRSKLNALEISFNKLKQDLDATKKGLYGDVQNLINNLPKVRKAANDALYETRQGRKILEGQIATIKKTANDALYEARQGRVKLDAQINTIKNQVTGLIAQITGIKINSDKVPKLEARVNTLKTDVSASDKAKIDKAASDASKAASDANKALTGLGTITPTINKAVNDQVGAIKRDFDLKLGLKLDKTALLPSIQANITAIFGFLSPSIRAFVLPLVATAIAPLTAFDTGIKLSFDLIGTKVNTQDAKIQDINRVNAEANAKLDRLLPLVLGFPALISQVPQGTIDKFNQQVAPKIPDMAAAGTCKTLQPGGCMRNGLDSLGNSINNNTNNSNNNLFNRINAGLGAVNASANAAQMAVLNTINTKLGPLIPGGLSEKLVNGFKWLQLDRALSLLTFAATVQNHVMLSRDIGQTLLGAFSNILSLIGLKDDSGQAFDIGSIINSSIENFVKGIVGTENYAQLSQAWAKANRIYQATTNVLNSFQNISSTILTGMELIGSYTGKIGNALKKSGEVLDSAYGWMNPQPKFNRISQTLENLQQGASTIQQVTQAPLDVINAVTELQTANTELIKAVKEDDKPENKAPAIPEPDKLKADELASKLASRISNILPDDIFNAGD